MLNLDGELVTALEKELPGILTWCVNAARDYLAMKDNPRPAVHLPQVEAFRLAVGRCLAEGLDPDRALDGFEVEPRNRALVLKTLRAVWPDAQRAARGLSE